MAPPPTLGDTSTDKEPRYTWKEVAQHVTASSAWIVSHDIVYDITAWLDKHPGGAEVLLLAAGRDCTNLIPSYHPFSTVPAALLQRYRIGSISDSSPREVPLYKPDTGFYAEVCADVKRYFVENKLDPKAPTQGLVNLALFIAVGIFSLAVSFNTGLPMLLRLCAAVLFGILQAMPLIHTMHDASHRALSHRPWLSQLVATLSLDFWAGGSINSWEHQHVIGHHLHTNIFGVDPDMPTQAKGDFRRIVKNQVWARVYQVQWLYLPLLYCFLAFKVRIQDITDTMLKGTSGNLRVRPLYTYMVLQQVLAKSLQIGWRLLLPLLYLQVPLLQLLLTSFVSELVTGLWLTYNFQVSHITPTAEFPEVSPKGEIDQEWAVCQVRSSLDYAHGDAITTFLSGALNYQSVHHLFPSVSQYHYPAIAPIVLRCCRKYGIKYNVLPSFTAALSAHVQHLYDLGVDFNPSH